MRKHQRKEEKIRKKAQRGAAVPFTGVPVSSSPSLTVPSTDVLSVVSAGGFATLAPSPDDTILAVTIPSADVVVPPGVISASVPSRNGAIPAVAVPSADVVVPLGVVSASVSSREPPPDP